MYKVGQRPGPALGATVPAETSDMAQYDEIEAVVGNQRRKIYVLLFIALAAVAVVAALRLIPRGIGNDEAADKVIIVHEQGGGLANYLGGYGFEAVTGSLNGWQNKIPEEWPEEMGGKEIGLAEILLFADRFGYGYVAIENPQRFDYSGLDIEPEVSFDEHTRFAVLSTGDFAFPHTFSKNPKPSDVMGGRGMDLLRALFAQEKLAEALDTANASMDGVQLRSTLSRAVDDLEQLEVLEKKVEQIRFETVDALQAKSAGGETQLQLADEVTEGSSALPLADGRVVLVSQAVSMTSENGIRLDMEVSRDYTVRALPAGDQGNWEARQACPEFLGGTLPRAERLATEVARDGSAVLVRTATEGFHIWRFDPAAGPCGLADAGSLSMPEDWGGYAAVQADKVATKVLESGEAVVDVVDVQGGHRRLGFVPSEGTKSLTWLDDEHLVLVSYVDWQTVSLVFLSTQRPDLVLEMRVPALSNIYELRPARAGDKPVLIVRTREQGNNQLVRLDFDQSWSALFENPVRMEGVEDLTREDLPTIVQVDPVAAHPTSIVSIDAEMKPFDISPNGQWAAYTSFADGGKEVFLVRIPERGGAKQAPVQVTKDELYDRDVRFSHDGKRLVWRTEHELGDVNGTLYSVRAVALAALTGN